jgi:NADPH-dependent curcumin reductase CurA
VNDKTGHAMWPVFSRRLSGTEGAPMSIPNSAGQRVVLASHPEGKLQAADFRVEDCPLPEVADGTFMVRNIFVSVDPMLRIFIDRTPLGSKSMPSLPPGTTIPGAAVGEIVESRHADFAVGDIVEGRFGWQHFAISNGQGVNRAPKSLTAIENALGIGGLPGFTAFIGLNVAALKPGQTMLVSGAAGAVGSAVGAFVRARGGRVVGIAGGEDKRRYLLDKVGYDAVADRHAPDFHAQLAAALPDGVNVYFDNVGGPMLAEMMPYMAFGGLVLISGLMAQYQGPAESGPDNLPAVLHTVMGKGVRIQSFSQYGQDALRPAFEAEVVQLLASPDFTPEMHIIDGLANLPQAQVDLFERSTTGKVVVRVSTGPGASI